MYSQVTKPGPYDLAVPPVSSKKSAFGFTKDAEDVDILVSLLAQEIEKKGTFTYCIVCPIEHNEVVSRSKQKITDRVNYRISKMKKGAEHFALIEKDGQGYMFDPVGRIPVDMKNLRDLIQKIFDAYKASKAKPTVTPN